MRTETLYLAGPMRSAENFGKKAFARGAKLLREQGHTVISPSEIDGTDGWPATWAAAMARDIPLVVEASHVVVLPGWEESPGTLVEVFVALVTGGQVYALNLDNGCLSRLPGFEIAAAWHRNMPLDSLFDRAYGRVPFDGREDWKNAVEEGGHVEQLRGVDQVELQSAPTGTMDYGRLREIADEMGALVVKKNKAYGSSFETSAEMLRLLYPQGIPVKRFGAALTLARVWDKMGRIATDEDAFGEDPWRDIVGYGLLMVELNERGVNDAG